MNFATSLRLTVYVYTSSSTFVLSLPQAGLSPPMTKAWRTTISSGTKSSLTELNSLGGRMSGPKWVVVGCADEARCDRASRPSLSRWGLSISRAYRICHGINQSCASGGQVWGLPRKASGMNLWLSPIPMELTTITLGRGLREIRQDAGESPARASADVWLVESVALQSHCRRPP